MSHCMMISHIRDTQAGRLRTEAEMLGAYLGPVVVQYAAGVLCWAVHCQVLHLQHAHDKSDLA